MSAATMAHWMSSGRIGGCLSGLIGSSTRVEVFVGLRCCLMDELSIESGGCLVWSSDRT